MKMDITQGEEIDETIKATIDKITGHFTFTSGIFPVWFLLVIAAILEDLA